MRNAATHGHLSKPASLRERASGTLRGQVASAIEEALPSALPNSVVFETSILNDPEVVFPIRLLEHRVQILLRGAEATPFRAPDPKVAVAKHGYRVYVSSPCRLVSRRATLCRSVVSKM